MTLETIKRLEFLPKMIVYFISIYIYIYIFHISYHLRRVALRQKPFFKGPSDKNLITIYN